MSGWVCACVFNHTIVRFTALTSVLTAVWVQDPHRSTYSSLCSRPSLVYLQQFVFTALTGVLTAVCVHDPPRCNYSSLGSQPS